MHTIHLDMSEISLGTSHIRGWSKRNLNVTYLQLCLRPRSWVRSLRRKGKMKRGPGVSPPLDILAGQRYADAMQKLSQSVSRPWRIEIQNMYPPKETRWSQGNGRNWGIEGTEGKRGALYHILNRVPPGSRGDSTHTTWMKRPGKLGSLKTIWKRKRPRQRPLLALQIWPSFQVPPLPLCLLSQAPCSVIIQVPEVSLPLTQEKDWWTNALCWSDAPKLNRQTGDSDPATPPFFLSSHGLRFFTSGPNHHPVFYNCAAFSPIAWVLLIICSSLWKICPGPSRCTENKEGALEGRKDGWWQGLEQHSTCPLPFQPGIWTMKLKSVST